MRRLFLLIFLAVAVAAPVAASPTEGGISQDEVRRIVIREAMNHPIVPPSLALAVAEAESDFVANAESSAGARGVMQIMPATARGEYGVDADRLWNPRVNICLGLHFLGRLIRRYDGRTDLALSYYNGGSAVGRSGRARVIPATRSYVRKVQKLRRQYRQKLRRGQV